MGKRISFPRDANEEELKLRISDCNNFPMDEMLDSLNDVINQILQSAPSRVCIRLILSVFFFSSSQFKERKILNSIYLSDMLGC